MEWRYKDIILIAALVVSLAALFVSFISVIIAYSQSYSTNIDIVYQRMDAYFIAYSGVSDGEIDVFATDYYKSHTEKKIALALTAERLLLVLDSMNRAGDKEMSHSWYRFLVTMRGPLCDKNIKLEGFAIEDNTKYQLKEAKRIACGYD